nr:sensor histidine kinase [uncultured Allomuricauda sp.]
MSKDTTGGFIVACIFLLVGFGKTYAQSSLEQEVDSLTHLIVSVPDDTLKIGRYEDLARKLLSLNRQSKMLEIANEGLTLSKKLEYDGGIAKMTLFKAIALDIMGKSDKAIPLYNIGLKMAKEQGEQELQARFYMNLGLCYRYMGDYDLALENQLYAYDLREAMSKKDLAKLLNNIGIIYRFQDKHKRAEEIYLKSLKLKQELKDSLGMAATLTNLGLVYNKIENRKEKSTQYLQRSKNLYQLLGRPDHVASCNISLGQIFLNQNNIPKAKEALNNAWKYYEKNIDQQYSPSTLASLSEIAVLENDFQLAKAYLEKALEISTSFGSKVDQVEILIGLSSIKKELGENADAYTMLKKAYGINDTLNQMSRLEAMEEMQAKFDVNEKISELKISELKLNEQTRQRNIFLFGAIGLALFAITIFFSLKGRIRSNKKIAEQTEAIQHKEIIELQQQNKLLALSSMIEGQEAERMRIAKDLHDGLGGLLSTVKAHFSAIQNEVTKLERLNLAEKTNELIDEACVEVRRISHDMIPHALTLSGLPAVLEDRAETLIGEGFKVDLDIQEFPEDMAKTRQAMLFRLIQEIISNIRKHANAKNILIQILGNDRGLSLIVEDDGDGFEFEKAMKSGGVGLKSINSRVEFLNGTIDWDSSLGKGTTITVNIPEV